MRLDTHSARVASVRSPGRLSAVAVFNVFSLRGAVNGLVQRQGASAASAIMERAPTDTLRRPKKAVSGVPLKDRPTVELIMALTSLDTKPTDALGDQLAEHELQLVTTSATCDSMFASVLDSISEDYASSGDGMASPLADIRAAAEQLAAEVRGSSIASDWNPSTSPKGSSFAPPPGSHHTLEKLMAQAEYDALNSSSSKDANSVMARVQHLQQQITAAASKAAAASSKPRSMAAPSSNSSSSTSTTSSSRSSAAKGTAKQASTTAGAASSFSAQRSSKPANLGAPAAEPTLQRYQPAVTMSFDEDSCGDAAAMPVIPGVLAGAGLMAGRLPGRATAKAASAPSYPVYKDPASSWLVADSADGRTRMLVIQAPKELAAAVTGARASSDLTTFEAYNLGAKINKALYSEANALYNRFMPLLRDHLEESGPSGRVMLCGSGLGGSLAALLLLMFVARGMRQSAFAPVYTLNAPAVLCEVPDFKQWCSKDGCSLQDMDGMMEDLLHRGILSQLGLPQDAVRNIYHNQGAAEAAVQAVTSKLGPLQAVAASSSKQLNSMVQHLDVAALRASPFVPEVLKSWLKSEASSGAAHNGMQRLHILNPVGQMLLYMASSGPGTGSLSNGKGQSYSRFTSNGSGSKAYSNGTH